MAEAIKVRCPSIAEAARWKGKVTAKILCFTPEKVWPFLEDFGNLHKIDPKVDVSYALEGVYGHAGLIRFCSAHTTTSLPSGENEIAIQWSHEKLLSMDPAKYSLTYEILENNVGFTYCRSTIKVLRLHGCCEFGSELEWTYESDPLPGQKPDSLSKKFGSDLQAMADTIKKILEAKSKCCIC